MFFCHDLTFYLPQVVASRIMLTQVVALCTLAAMSTRVRTWEVLDYGEVDRSSPTIPFQAECGHEAELPVCGRVMAITSGAIIFDVEGGKSPAKIRCRRCGRVFVNSTESTPSFIGMANVR